MEKSIFFSKAKNKQNRNNRKKGIAILNHPINDEHSDAIGFDAYVQSIDAAIKTGAEIIAIESDFGNGKSSVIELYKNKDRVQSFRLLRRLLNYYKKRIISINLWHVMNDECEEEKFSTDFRKELHKSFLYQAVSAKGAFKAGYISRRLSSNYGLVSFKGESFIHGFISVIGCALLFLGCLKGKFSVSLQYVIDRVGDWKLEEVQPLFVLAGITLLVLTLLTGDIVFSSRNSEGKRQVDENVLIDIFRKEFYRRWLFRHYIFVVEDLDRNNNIDSIESFIREIRRYYFIEKNWLERVLHNKVTFIICIKPEIMLHNNPLENSEGDGEKANRINEGEVASTKGKAIDGEPNEIIENSSTDMTKENFYTKAFDYIVRLPRISIDNREAILCSILNSNKPELIEMGLIEKNEYITIESINGLQWITHGKNVNIREMKNRLNQALIMYNRIRRLELVEEEDVFQKCAVVVYLKSEFEKDFYSLTDGDMQTVLDEYLRNESGFGECLNVSKEFLEQIKILIDRKIIDLNYRCYFYNMPLGSKKYSSDEMKVFNSIVYGETPTDREAYSRLIADINEAVINDAYNKRNQLGLGLPEFIVDNSKTIKVAFEKYLDGFKSLINEHQYDVNNIVAAKDFVKKVLSYHSEKNEREQYVCVVANSVLSSVTDKNVLLEIRKCICELFTEEILCYKEMYMGDNPFISTEEIEIIKRPKTIIELINFDNEVVNYDDDAIQMLHNLICQSDMGYEESIGFYDNLIKKFGIKNMQSILYDWLETYKVFPGIFNEYYEFGLNDGIIKKEEFVRALEYCSTIEESTLRLFSSIEWNKEVSQELAKTLRENGFVLDYLIAEVLRKENYVDYKDENIKNSILENANYLKENLVDCYKAIRAGILKQGIIDKDYDALFDGEIFLSAEELMQIQDYRYAIDLLKRQNSITNIIEDLAVYFSCCRRNSTATYEIICYILTLPKETAYKIFYNLNMDSFSYPLMSKKRRNELNRKLISLFDVEKSIDEKLKFLSFIKDSVVEIEKDICDELNEENEEKYVNYANSLKNVNDVVLNNLLKLSKAYIYSDVINKELYDTKKYYSYVSSKVRGEKRFEIEQDKIDILWKIYVNTFHNADRKLTQRIMRTNTNFVNELILQKEYVNAGEQIINYAYGMQTKELLEYVFDNLIESVITEYLSQTKGFADREAAHFFVQRVVSDSELLLSDSVYANCYEHLIDTGLKSWYTRKRNDFFK